MIPGDIKSMLRFGRSKITVLRALQAAHLLPPETTHHDLPDILVTNELTMADIIRAMHQHAPGEERIVYYLLAKHRAEVTIAGYQIPGELLPFIPDSEAQVVESINSEMMPHGAKYWRPGITLLELSVATGRSMVRLRRAVKRGAIVLSPPPLATPLDPGYGGTDKEEDQQ